MTVFAAERMALLVKLYFSILGRPPDEEGLRSLFASEYSIDELRDICSTSPETLELAAVVGRVRGLVERSGAERNILMLSAYGNGNLGDRAMARPLSDYLESTFDVKVFTYSSLDVAAYDLNDNTRRLSASDRPLNMLVMSLFDGLVLGGGGYLACPHDPVWDPAWAYQIPIPYGILANGVENPLPPNLRTLVSRAAFATGRDPLSVEALASYNANSFHCPDPILALSPLSAKAKEPGKGRLFLLRGPRRKHHENVAAALTADDYVAAFEPAVDYPLVDRFPSMRFVTSLAQLDELMRGCDTVVSERYHGVITGFLAGKRVYAIPQEAHNESKMQEIFYMLEIDRFYGDSWSRSGNENYPFDEVRTKLEGIRAAFPHATKKAMACLMEE